MGPEENWRGQMKVILPPHTLLPCLIWAPLWPFSFNLAQPLCFPSNFHLLLHNVSFQLFSAQVWGLVLSVLHTLGLSAPGFSFSPSTRSFTSFSSSWTMSWCLTITASVSLTHTNPALPVLTLLGQCLLSLHSEWIRTALVCASLLLYSGIRSTHFVLFMIHYVLCVFVLPLKLSGSIRIHWVWQISVVN